MATSAQAFVSLPLLRAIEQLPETIEVDGVELRFTGEVTSAPIVCGFAAHRALVAWEHGTGTVDLSSASSSRSELTLRLEGVSAARAERLLLGLRRAMMADTQTTSALTTSERIAACRSA